VDGDAVTLADTVTVTLVDADLQAALQARARDQWQVVRANEHAAIFT